MADWNKCDTDKNHAVSCSRNIGVVIENLYRFSMYSEITDNIPKIRCTSTRKHTHNDAQHIKCVNGRFYVRMCLLCVYME